METDLDVDWLKLNNQPAAEVKLKWSATFYMRPRCDNAIKYLKTYKCLETEYGHQLVKFTHERFIHNEEFKSAFHFSNQ